MENYLKVLVAILDFEKKRIKKKFLVILFIYLLLLDWVFTDGSSKIFWNCIDINNNNYVVEVFWISNRHPIDMTTVISITNQESLTC